VALSDDLEAIAARAAAHADAGEELEGVIAAEPASGRRVYLCAYRRGEERSWLALDGGGEPIARRSLVRDAVSIAALCELAVDSAGGGELEELRARLVAVRLSENPPGIEQAEDAALGLERTLGAPPRLATPAYLDEVGAATRRLELALGEPAGSPFAQAMRHAYTVVDALAAEVEGRYKRSLS
jgi:hypothetical protein